MSIKQQLNKDLADAMRAGETDKRDVLRMLTAAIKQVEVDEQKELTDQEVTDVLTKQAKQRRESIADYEKAGRPELAKVEEAELAVIESYLPKMMSRDEIAALASAVIADVGAQGPQAMGQVMGKLMPQVKGKADGRLVNEVVRELLAN